MYVVYDTCKRLIKRVHTLQGVQMMVIMNQGTEESSNARGSQTIIILSNFIEI